MPSPYVRGARKVGRPFCEDRAYAEDVGVTLRMVRKYGGAEYLKSLPESSRNLIFKQLAAPKTWGLASRGMNVKKPFQVQKEEAFERYCNALLRERGLR